MADRLLHADLVGIGDGGDIEVELPQHGADLGRVLDRIAQHRRMRIGRVADHQRQAPLSLGWIGKRQEGSNGHASTSRLSPDPAAAPSGRDGGARQQRLAHRFSRQKAGAAAAGRHASKVVIATSSFE